MKALKMCRTVEHGTRRRCTELQATDVPSMVWSIAMFAVLIAGLLAFVRWFISPVIARLRDISEAVRLHHPDALSTPETSEENAVGVIHEPQR
jgi:hypothetical protein